MKKGLIGIAVGIVVVMAVFGLIAPVQAQTYTVWGQVFDTDGVTPVDGVNVTVTDLDTTDSLSAVTAGGGWYQTVFGPPSTDPVNIGDTLQIVATYGTLTNTTTVTATGSPQQVNLILTTGPDITPPVISSVASSSITTSSAVITWTTDEISDSLVKYGTAAGTYTLTASDPADVMSHSISLTGLSAGTIYYYVVNSTDPGGNSAESAEYSFTTTETINYLLYIIVVILVIVVVLAITYLIRKKR